MKEKDYYLKKLNNVMLFLILMMYSQIWKEKK